MQWCAIYLTTVQTPPPPPPRVLTLSVPQAMRHVMDLRLQLMIAPLWSRWS